MPPKIQYTKEQIVDAAIEIIRKEGPSSLNARAVAKQLGCSTQPIFREFESMTALKDAVIRKASAIYEAYIRRWCTKAEKPYKAAGTAYIRFAAEEKALFHLLFMRDRSREGEEYEDGNLEIYLDEISRVLKIGRDAAYEFHIRMWIYTHGMAVMTATDYLHFTDEQISALLTEEFTALKERFGNKNEEYHRN